MVSCDHPQWINRAYEEHRYSVLERRLRWSQAVAELINRLTSGGVGAKSDDPRFVQTKRLWDLGWGRELKMSSFDEYLATVPRVPDPPPITTYDRLVLVDRRVSLVTTWLAGVNFDGDNKTFRPFDKMGARSVGISWIWCNDGRENRGRSPRRCRAEFRNSEFELYSFECDAFEGVAIYAQDPGVIKGHYLDLPGSVRAIEPDHIASLGIWDAEPKLYWRCDDSESPIFGAASRWE